MPAHKGANKLSGTAGKQIEEQRVVHKKWHSNETLSNELVHVEIEHARWSLIEDIEHKTNVETIDKVKRRLVGVGIGVVVPTGHEADLERVEQVHNARGNTQHDKHARELHYFGMLLQFL